MSAPTLTNLGNAYGALGDAAKQKVLLERALAIKEHHYGADHPSLATTLTNLGTAYGALGDAAKQKALLERALAINERHYGPDHAEVAITVFNLGLAHKAVGNIQEARKCMERCLAIETACYGASHPNTKYTTAAIAELPRQTDHSTVAGLVSFVKNAVPGLAATLGALGEHAPLVVVVVSVLKVAGAAYVTDDSATLTALYEQFAGTVIATTRLVLAVHEFQQANHVTLPGTVTSALDIYWQQLDTFAALLVQFRGTDYAKRLFAKGAHQAQLRAVQSAVEQAASDLNQTGILTSAVQSELILRNSADGKATLRETYALAKERQDLSIAAGHVWVVATLTGAKFVGREAELVTLQEQLRPSKDTATCVVISGTVGTGKSTLAQRAAETCRARFSSGWTLDGSKKEALLTGLSRVARDLQLGELKPDEVAPAVQSRLNKADVAGWLVIVDNVDDAAMKARLPALLPSQGGCAQNGEMRAVETRTRQPPTSRLWTCSLQRGPQALSSQIEHIPMLYRHGPKFRAH